MILRTQRLNRTLAMVGLAAAVSLSVGSAQAEPSKRLGQFKDWGAYTYNTPKGKVCYVLSLPKEQQPKGVNRDPVYFFVTDRPGENVSNEVSVIIGYPFKQGSKGEVEIRSAKGNNKYAMVTNEDTAWLENVAEQSNVVNDMKAGRDMVVRGTSGRGTNTTDTYSLFGISAALSSAKSACQ